MSYEYPVDYETYSIEEVETIIDFLSYLEENHKHLDFKIFKAKVHTFA